MTANLLTREGRAEAWLPILDAEVLKIVELTGVDPSDFKSAGKVTKDTPYGEDLAWWIDEGMRQAELYANWYERSGWKLAVMPDGKPGIEWEAEVVIAGEPVRLIIDAIYENAFGDWIVVDYKTGKWTPTDAEQMGLYATAVEIAYGRRPQWGAFYMTRKGQLEGLSRMDEYTIEYFEREFGEMNDQIEDRHFPPNPGKRCNNCFVKRFCIAINGPYSQDYPLVIKEK